MNRKFPHLNDSSFPHIDNIDVYKYANEFDYARFNYSQMDIVVCNVPWDVGEARIGTRTIEGIGNVVFFESTEERDSWFDSIPDSKCFRWTTKMRQLHRDEYIDLPLPFDIAARYNYVVVKYSMFANDNSPVLYEDAEGLREWFWFIRDVEFVAPNCTRVHLLIDAWQTFIYDLDITGMILERGHAPMKATNADSYLQNPRGNSGNLLAPDYTADNAAYMATSSGELIFNAGNMKAVIVTTSNPTGSWGTKAGDTWHTPTGHYAVQGAPAYYAFAIAASDLTAFLYAVDTQAPQFMPTVKAICFLNSSLLSLGASFTFCGIDCNGVGADYVSNDVLSITKDKFGYPSRYEDIAKLYTYPYSYIELSDGKGDVTEIRIEMTNGKITLDTCVNLVYPFLKINGHVSSVGKSARKQISFANISSRNMPIQGNWYEYLQSWDIPTFGVVQQASTRNDYSTHFDRAQQVVAYTNTYDSSVASANTAQADVNANAATLVSNAALQTAQNTAQTANSNALITANTATVYTFNRDTATASNEQIENTTNNQIQADQQTAAIATASGAVSTGANVASSLASGNISGAVSALIGGGASIAETIANTAVTVNLTTAQASVSKMANNRNASLAGDKGNSTLINEKDAADASTVLSNNLTTSTAANQAATMNANAARDNATEIANAGRSRNTAQNAITNQIAQAALDAPIESGSFGYGDSATTRPVGAFANIVTMDDFSTQDVGDEFLRYGYMFGKQWTFNGDWNVCDRFTYWKLKDFWVSGLSIADMYVDRLRFFLFGGVTVWRRPEYIGNTDIYHNGL